MGDLHNVKSLTVIADTKGDRTGQRSRWPWRYCDLRIKAGVIKATVG